MKTYHYNATTNEVGECSAKYKCPLNSDHFNTVAEAQHYGEQLNTKQTLPKPLRKRNQSNNSTQHALTAWTEFEESKNFINPDGISNLGLDTTPQDAKPELLDSGYYDSHEILGELQKDKLTHESYKHFGFKGSNALFDYPSKDFLDQIENESKNELQPLTRKEKFTLSLYSSQEFKNINPVLNGQKSIHELDDDVDTFIQRIGVLDQAIAKGPGKQRKVYRGDSHLSQIDDFHEGEGNRNIHSWVDENRTLGSTVSFSSYVSTTPNVESAKTYLGTQKSGVIYEIQTSKGINLSSISGYGDEHEVLLPRESTYVVVGVQKPRDDIAIVQLVENHSKTS